MAITIPKPYIEKLQNRKKCKECIGGGRRIGEYNQPNDNCPECQGTGYEPIELIFPANNITKLKKKL